MASYPLLANDDARVAALRKLAILDTPPEADFDAIVRLIAAICETPVALISLVDAERQWYKARIGVDACENSRDVSFCAHAIANPDEILHVPDATSDLRFARNPLVVGPPFVRFYAGMPLVTSTGAAIGTVCVLDTVPRELSREQLEALRLVARVAVILMERRQTIDELSKLRREHESASERLRFLAHHDGLTSLPNRTYFLELMQRELAAGSNFAIAFVDLDRFKEINDTLGHAAGDELLVMLAQRVRRVIRPEDVVARIGGDEFTICFRNIPSEDAACTAAQRVAAELRRPYALGAGERQVIASIGVARPRESATVASLLRDADTAMYAAKASGMGNVRLYASELARQPS